MCWIIYFCFVLTFCQAVNYFSCHRPVILSNVLNFLPQILGRSLWLQSCRPDLFLVGEKYQSLKGVQRLRENCFLNPNSTRERAVKWTPVCCASGSQRTRQAGMSHTGLPPFLPPSLPPSFLYVTFLRSVVALQLHFRTILRKSSVVLGLYASTFVKIRVQWARWQKSSGQTFVTIHFVLSSLFLKKKSYKNDSLNFLKCVT